MDAVYVGLLDGWLLQEIQKFKTWRSNVLILLKCR